MRIFLDTANIDQIKQAAKLGVISGVTTNPSLVSKEGGNTDYKTVIREICSIVPGPISAEVVVEGVQPMVEQARQIAAAIWGSRLAVNHAKMVMVVEEDVDIHTLSSLQLAFQTNVDPAKGVVVFPEELGTSLDVAIRHDERNELAWGAGLQNKLLIDATIDWTSHPLRPEWGNRRLPPLCTESAPATVELVNKKWKEYGL